MLDLPSFLYGACASVALIGGWFFVDFHFGASPRERAERKRLKGQQRWERRAGR